ncbi:MAG: hypothetical protein A2Z34_10310 [Planctomycetes bacterium RBG_16_59_8]|nr:MAG: hypothetical protein A2Z34_10310 [Planctomycetes bacterium RBG_16_59_8]
MYVAILVAAAVAVATAAVAAVLASRQAIRTREQASRAGEAQRLAFLGTLATGLAHEIRNPLSTININLQLLKEAWQTPITEREQREYRKIEMLLKETRRLEEILNNFLEFSRTHQPNRSPCNINLLLDDVSDLFAPQAERQHIRIVRNFDRRIPPISADRNQISQAITNIVLNAIQAMPGGGTISVRTSLKQQTAHIEIADTGAGIPPEAADRIFNVYFSTKTEGTGLGLSITKRIIEEHGGTISMKSAPGEGTTFLIDFPATTV